ncbi:hypothetical protein TBLA_0G00310 [Henningerozyma blattae CBS 6284]|uniref:Calcineurin-like phosphoesterase domain-containing protein n=1 Tax=Henningerozyma blattae (strain ATCC 34711 / CBS 6284 / DSM 70876 / NBRC 10599 / NRRL Y-10934 / UCD 77-7) TaxID=1071380 RepID=I2H6H8_HENB6|nr:hypothetical protein TBLA_0G00310 [Tetrapisispora blattae CBS 6284]CCH61980.1 hypothetical protein TBLA_0G00310 [Tetrapisispora blattae CBS 6284]
MQFESIKLLDETNSHRPGFYVRFKNVIVGFITLLATLTIFIKISQQHNSNTIIMELPVINTFETIKLDEYPNVNRLLFIGDVHGEYDTMTSLFEEMNYDSDTDMVILVGDFLTKGPDSLKVLDFLVDSIHKGNRNVRYVLGNNDIKVLVALINQDMENYSKESEFNPLNFNTEFNYVPKDPLKKIKQSHLKLANELGFKKLYELAKHSTVAFKIQRSNNDASHALFAVHAGLLPGNFINTTLNANDNELFIPSIDTLTEMKFVEQDNWSNTYKQLGMKDKKKKSNDIDATKKSLIKWYKLWDETKVEQTFNDNKKIQKNFDYDLLEFSEIINNITVVYGHDASSGLNIHNHTKGLDSGCTKGGQLSGLEFVWDPTNNKYIDTLYQVDCIKK